VRFSTALRAVLDASRKDADIPRGSGLEWGKGLTPMTPIGSIKNKATEDWRG
jgi:hypothetical protein